MKANFNLALTLEQREVTQKIGINNVEDMDNKLFRRKRKKKLLLLPETLVATINVSYMC